MIIKDFLFFKKFLYMIFDLKWQPKFYFSNKIENKIEKKYKFFI